MAREIVADTGLDKDNCKHFGEYGYADGYFGGKYCRIDGCSDAVECSNKMKDLIADHCGDYILAMISNREKGTVDKENEGKQTEQARKPGPKDIKDEKKPEIEENKEEERTENKNKALVICKGCLKEVDYLNQSEAGMGYIKCPHCKRVIDQTGRIY